MERTLSKHLPLKTAFLNTRLALFEFAISHSLEELLQKAVDEVCALTNSPIGFYHFVKNDQKTLSLQAWSTRTAEEFCKAEGKGMHYGIDQAGVWVECVYQRRPVIHNDYASLPHRKGMPPGHAAVVRELVVPIMRADRIVAILGVGNKSADYTEKDVEIVSFLADVAWVIAEHKCTEEALREREHYLSTIINATRDGFWVLDANGKVSDVNEAYCHMSGYTRNELLQLRIPDLEVDETPDETAARIKRIIKNGSELFETRHRRKDGSFFEVEISVTWLDKDVHQFVCFCRDVTERKTMEQALKESEENLRVIFDTVYSGVILVDAAGIITFANRRMAEMFGLDIEELIGSSYTEHVHETQSKEGEQMMFQLIQGDIDHVFLERLYRKKDGTVFWGHLSGSRLCHLDGSFSSLVGVITDISERKRLEDQLQQAHKMEAISTLTGGIAHDYNNLLAIIMGNLSMAREEMEPHSVIAGLLHEMEKASSKARDLTHQLMTLSRGGHPMKERGSIESLLKEILLEVKAHEGIEYTLSIQDDLWPVEYDSRQMHFAISNILINAVESMPQRGTITIQVENQVIVDKSNDSAVPLNNGKYVRISIKDEGRGIPKKHLNKIFDPYFSTKERGEQKGMGMGLTTAYAVVQKHDGNIMVNSTTGVGTIVTIYLPAECAESKAPGAKRDDTTPSISSGQPTTKKILVMDDEESLRTLAQRMLERLGYKAETVKDGAEAIETYKKHMDSGEPFDGVILDLTIKGGMGGDQAIKELIKIDPDVKAIVCSGYFNDPVLAHFEEHGFRGAMAKPYQKADLESVLKKVLG